MFSSERLDLILSNLRARLSHYDAVDNGLRQLGEDRSLINCGFCAGEEAAKKVKTEGLCNGVQDGSGKETCVCVTVDRLISLSIELNKSLLLNSDNPINLHLSVAVTKSGWTIDHDLLLT